MMPFELVNGKGGVEIKGLLCCAEFRVKGRGGLYSIIIILLFEHAFTTERVQFKMIWPFFNRHSTFGKKLVGHSGTPKILVII